MRPTLPGFRLAVQRRVDVDLATKHLSRRRHPSAESPTPAPSPTESAVADRPTRIGSDQPLDRSSLSRFCREATGLCGIFTLSRSPNKRIQRVGVRHVLSWGSLPKARHCLPCSHSAFPVNSTTESIRGMYANHNSGSRSNPCPWATPLRECARRRFEQGRLSQQPEDGRLPLSRWWECPAHLVSVKQSGAAFHVFVRSIQPF